MQCNLHVQLIQAVRGMACMLDAVGTDAGSVQGCVATNSGWAPLTRTPAGRVPAPLLDSLVRHLLKVDHPKKPIAAAPRVSGTVRGRMKAQESTAPGQPGSA